MLLLFNALGISSVKVYAQEEPADGLQETETFVTEEEDLSEESVSLPADEETSVTEETEKTAEEISAGDELSEEEGLHFSDKDSEIEEGALFEIPEDFVLRRSDVEGKKKIIENGVAEAFDQLVEGKDYTENELFFLANDSDYAKTVAKIYGAQLKSYFDGVALIKIDPEKTSVKQAFMACLDEKSGLPLVEPNYLIYLEPVHEESKKSGEYTVDGGTLPKTKGYNDWINDVFNDPDPLLLYTSDYDYQWQHDMVNSYTGWNATMGSSDILVAVIDETVNVDHEELYGKAMIEDIGLGTDFGIGHGNHVAGIIAANVNNGKGGAGIAPNVRILGINVFLEGGGASDADIARAINRAVSRGARIINMSLGGPMYNSSLDQTIQNAYKNGVTMVASAGNEGNNTRNYPACYDHVICVGAVTYNGYRASYSNYGPWITISAPGSFITSSCSTSDEPYDDRYEEMSGTSMATPVVTGAIALYMSKFGIVSPDEMLKVLKSSVSKCYSSQMGAGIVDLEKMFKKADNAPVISVYNPSNVLISDLSKPVPEGSYFKLAPYDGGQDMVLYTIGSQKPTVKNGEIVTGEVYTPGSRIYMDQFEKGTVVKVNVASVNGFGVLSKAATYSIKAPAVTVQPFKIKTITLSSTKETLNYSSFNADSIYLYPTSMINTAGADVYLDEVEHIWTSSNTAVAEVDENGRVTATGAGSAKITLKVLDGSNKSTSCNITVNRLVDSLNIAGPSAIAPGTSATFKADILPTNAKNKKVSWDIYGGADGVSITSSGQVKVDKNAAVGDVFMIFAFTQDGSELTAYKQVQIAPKATAVSLYTYDSRAVYNNKGVLTSASIFTVDIQDYAHPDNDNEIQLYPNITGNSIPPLWSSNNTKAATVDENGLVRAVGAGKATITCTANDGSGKKASVTINVNVPASGLKFDFDDWFANYVCAGAAVDLKTKYGLGSAYGKPTVSKVQWTILDVYTEDGTDITYEALNKNYIKFNGDKFTVANAAGLNSYLNYGFVYCDIMAKTTDGTDYEAYQTMVITKKPTECWFYYKGPYVLYRDGYYNTNWLVTDQPTPIEFKSSNPNVIAIEYGYDGYDADGYNYWIEVTSVGKAGSVTITAKLLDGSGKTATFKVNVK